MLTIVNPVLLLHAGNLSGENVVSVVTTHRTWELEVMDVLVSGL